jgi:tRNA U34 5-carboxymethylaminomethyl modifying GTPase MnmE/TrmE
VREEIEALRGEIIACLMLCEAEIDFGDTEEIDGNVIQQGKHTIPSTKRAGPEPKPRSKGSNICPSR